MVKLEKGTKKFVQFATTVFSPESVKTILVVNLHVLTNTEDKIALHMLN